MSPVENAPAVPIGSAGPFLGKPRELRAYKGACYLALWIFASSFEGGAEPSQIFSSSFDGGQSPLGFFRLPLTGAERSAEAASLSPMPTENIFLIFCEKNIVLFDCCVPPRSISAPIHPLLSSSGCRLEPPACTELRGMRSSWSSESFFPASSRESASFFESLSQVLAFWIRPSTMLRLGVG